MTNKNEEERVHYTPAGPVVQEADSYTDFMCICTDKSREKAEACMKRVLEALKTEPENLVSSVVYALTWSLPYGLVGNITGVPCDQWCAVTGELITTDGGLIPQAEEKVADFFIQCDRVEHGFARIYELMVEAAEELKRKHDEKPPTEDDVET